MITITGQGGHASEPFRAVDPIPVACEIVQALQTMVTRTIDVFDPCVVTVGRIAAGTTDNIIPETAHIEGTIRAVSETTRARVHGNIGRVAEGIAAAHGVTASVDIENGYPVTVNDGSSPTTHWPLPSSSPGAATSSSCRIRSWVPRTSATSCNECPGR